LSWHTVSNFNENFFLEMPEINNNAKTVIYNGWVNFSEFCGSLTCLIRHGCCNWHHRRTESLCGRTEVTAQKFHLFTATTAKVKNWVVRRSVYTLRLCRRAVWHTLPNSWQNTSVPKADRNASRMLIGNTNLLFE